jgi:hypothetical protein
VLQPGVQDAGERTLSIAYQKVPHSGLLCNSEAVAGGLSPEEGAQEGDEACGRGYPRGKPPQVTPFLSLRSRAALLFHALRTSQNLTE